MFSRQVKILELKTPYDLKNLFLELPVTASLWGAQTEKYILAVELLPGGSEEGGATLPGLPVTPKARPRKVSKSRHDISSSYKRAKKNGNYPSGTSAWDQSTQVCVQCSLLLDHVWAIHLAMMI